MPPFPVNGWRIDIHKKIYRNSIVTRLQASSRHFMSIFEALNWIGFPLVSFDRHLLHRVGCCLLSSFPPFWSATARPSRPWSTQWPYPPWSASPPSYVAVTSLICSSSPFEFVLQFQLIVRFLLADSWSQVSRARYKDNKLRNSLKLKQ